MKRILEAAKDIEAELEERIRYFKSEDKLLEAQRISERTNFDIEMLKETGSAPVSRTIPAILTVARRVNGLSVCSIISRKTFCWWLTRAT